MSTLRSLSKQKRRLSVLFSLSIFFIIVVLDIGFLSFKYFNYQRQEFTRLSFQAQGIARVIMTNPRLEQNILEGKGLSLPMNAQRTGPQGQWRPGERRGIQMDNFLLYNKQDGKMLFSPHKDDELYEFIVKEVQSRTTAGEVSFELNGSEYFFVNTPVATGINAVLFTESRMTIDGVIIDILIYLAGAVLLSLGVYVISSRFVDRTLSPVEKSIDDMEQFIHNAGHELKTPLSVVKSSLELMRLSKKYDEGIAESIGELDRMNGLIQALINLSTADNHTDVESIDIREACETLQKSYQEKLDEKGISLQIITKKPLLVQANREYTKMLLGNLLSNAIKYNRQNGTIVITIDHKSVTIQDTGIGIAKENLDKVFDRFYQEDGARVKDSFGIGLSLVRKIAHMYRWIVTVESEKWKGTTVKVRF